MKIDIKIYNNIINTLKNSENETGGIIGEKGGIICDFCFDKGLSPNKNYYVPNTKLLNEVIKTWESKGVSFVGVIHSHLYGSSCLSPEDKLYALMVKSAMPDLKNLFFPVFTSTGEKHKIKFYDVLHNFQIVNVEIV